MHQGKKLKALLVSKNIILKDFAKQAGISYSGLNLILNRQTIDIPKLEKFSELLEVPISFWYNYDINSIENVVNFDNIVKNEYADIIEIEDENIQKLNDRIEYLKKEIALKDEMIDLYMEIMILKKVKL